MDVTISAGEMAACVEAALGIDLEACGCAAVILVGAKDTDVEVDTSGYVLLAAPAATGGCNIHHDVHPGG
ncbi:MAG TPA: hypothetical protein PLL30_17235 [Candidatus Krumholzibacteria bacterium]|nr:hypothetical protein [Candidatus Krumholzibacteria bacterium]HPD73520.1 hypothetical protein [Candidatus Krumholzibacteria bacterium]HRY42242.1 hypothetical protein [Candidatus Krumholzibacteria bacterium]